MSPPPRIVVVSPCRDEEETFAATLASMEAQTRPPDLWLVVDDGSRDATPRLLDEAAARVPWMQVVHRRDRGYRRLGGGVIEAFDHGLAQVEGDYDYIAKLDVDLEFPPRYIERLLELFEADPKLAAASGKVYRHGPDGALVEEFMVDEMVAGQFKFYRRDAFEAIGGFVREVMWDGIDFHRARMEGWRTASLQDDELRIVHLRLMGSSDRGVYEGRLRWGRGQWFMGSSFAYVLASGIFRMREEPRLIGGLLIIAGYLGAALRRAPRYGDEAFRQELRRWQHARLRALLRGGDAR